MNNLRDIPIANIKMSDNDFKYWWEQTNNDVETNYNGFGDTLEEIYYEHSTAK